MKELRPDWTTEIQITSFYAKEQYQQRYGPRYPTPAIIEIDRKIFTVYLKV
jgi:hypothetical protein